MRVMLVGGGTAGHINPALAAAKYIRKKHPDAELLFIGTQRGLEKTLVPREGFDIQFIEVQGFKRSLSPKNLIAIAKAALAYSKSAGIIKRFKPDVVIGTGGYVSGPVLAAAAKKGVPTLIHEPNVSAGLTSKMLSKMVDVVCVSFEESRRYFPEAKKIVLTGNAIRAELFEYTKAAAREALGLDGRPFIAVFGGSLGAKKINESVAEFIKSTIGRSDFQLLLAAGSAHYEAVSKMISGLGVTEQTAPHIKVVEYIHNMAQVMNAADIVVARAGAITVSEITALGKPSVLIPSPNVTDNHQEHNARALEKAGAAIVLTEGELTDGVFSCALSELVFDTERLDGMSVRSAEMGIKNGAEKIYDEIKAIIK